VTRLAESFEIECPLGRFASLPDLWHASAPHYRGVTKRYDSWDVFRFGDITVVAVAGALSGESASGARFSGVRYLDRLVLRGPRLVLHQFWNDLAHAAVVGPMPLLNRHPSQNEQPGHDQLTRGVVEAITRFQAACCAGRAAEARGMVSDRAEFVMPFAAFSDIDQVVEWGRRRFRWIEKDHHSWDVGSAADGGVTVIDVGTVHGETAAGIAFREVRFADRLLVRKGRVVRHEAWNDLAYRLGPSRP